MLALGKLSNYGVVGNSVRRFTTSHRLEHRFIEDVKRVEQELARKQNGIVDIEIEHTPAKEIVTNRVFYRFIEQYHEVQKRQRIVDNALNLPKSSPVTTTSE